MAEGQAEIEHWRKSGYVGVDMETASTFAVAQYFRMQRCSLLFVFDTPREGGHILLTDAGKRDRRRLGDQAMIDAVFSFIERLR